MEKHDDYICSNYCNILREVYGDQIPRFKQLFRNVICLCSFTHESNITRGMVQGAKLIVLGRVTTWLLDILLNNCRCITIIEIGYDLVTGYNP